MAKKKTAVKAAKKEAAPKKKAAVKKRHHSADSGKMVSKEFAKANSKTTYASPAKKKKK